MPPFSVNAIGDVLAQTEHDSIDESGIEPRMDSLPRNLFARLHIRGSEGATAIKDVLRATTLVGAMGQCNIQLVGPGIAPAHCAITVESGRLLVHDLRSRSGTWLNGLRVDVASLADKDLLRVGEFACRVETNLPRSVELRRSPPNLM
jgi:hypothetical protein